MVSSFFSMAKRRRIDSSKKVSNLFPMVKRRRADSSKKVSTLLSMEKRRRAKSSKKTSDRRSSIDRISSLPDESFNSNDRISFLPDELLTSILSHLTFKEATATSLLSHRWRYVWTFTPKLQFDGTNSLLKVDFRDENRELVLNKERSKYIRWVNNVIALHKNSTIEEFDIFFNLKWNNRKWIDRWLRFAFARKVQRLSLNLTKKASWTQDEFYTFPYHLVHRTNMLNVFNTSAKSWSMKGCDSSDFKLLKSISLNNVNVNGETLEFFLSNCPLLEDMSVSASEELLSLKVIKPSSLFKGLKIRHCENLCSVEIRDANLVSLKYVGERIPFVLENVPLLVDLYVGGAVTHNLVDVIFMFSSILSQIETCTLDCFELSRAETRQFHSRVKMCKLKQLVVILFVDGDKSLLSLANLTSASPCLQRFVVVVSRDGCKFLKRKLQNVEHCYAQLKEVEFVGYTGAASDLELVMHLVNNAAALEKIVVDPSFPHQSRFDHMSTYNSASRDRDDIIKKAEDARTRAQKQLMNVIPAKIKLEILPIMSDFRSDIF